MLSNPARPLHRLASACPAKLSCQCRPNHPGALPSGPMTSIPANAHQTPPLPDLLCITLHSSPAVPIRTDPERCLASLSAPILPLRTITSRGDAAHRDAFLPFQTSASQAIALLDGATLSNPADATHGVPHHPGALLSLPAIPQHRSTNRCRPCRSPACRCTPAVPIRVDTGRGDTIPAFAGLPIPAAAQHAIARA